MYLWQWRSQATHRKVSRLVLIPKYSFQNRRVVMSMPYWAKSEIMKSALMWSTIAKREALSVPTKLHYLLDMAQEPPDPKYVKERNWPICRHATQLLNHFQCPVPEIM